jgi:Glycosyl transferase family 11
MKRLVQWIQLPEFVPLPVMDRVFEECTSAFEDDGCVVRRVTRWDELEDGGLIFLDDAGGRYLEPEFHPHHVRLAQRCPMSIMICWYWMEATYRPFSRMLVTGENYIYRERASPVVRAYMLRPDFVPLLLRASESPDRIGTYPRTIQRDYCFMGGGYKMDWIPPSDKPLTGLYHRVIYQNYLSYDERRAIYLSSRFALAFQSDENLRTGHLSQRIFEGLAYGCIVFCENPLAAQYTKGAVITVSSREDLWAKMEEWSQASPERIKEQQERGYEWSRRFGTNRTSMALLWSRVRARFHVDWKVSTSVVSPHLTGGLGNQLFQLAASYTHAQRYGTRFQILRRVENGNRDFYWNTLLQRFQPYLTDQLSHLVRWEQGPATIYRPIPAPSDTGLLLDGYFQTSKYIGTSWARERLYHLFRAPSDIEHSVQQAYPYLMRNAHRVVVLHARRTDYLIHAAFHGPLPMSYYQEAVKRMSGLIADPIFLLCGDDPSFWAHLSDDLPLVHSCPHVVLEQETDVRTFVLLQQFRHFIMSNSTFIWWVVWMAERAARSRVIVPAQWFGPMGLRQWEDIYESHWIRI